MSALRQQLLRSLAQNGVKPRLVYSLDALQAEQDRRNAWLLRAGKVAKRLNEEAKRDPK